MVQVEHEHPYQKIPVRVHRLAAFRHELFRRAKEISISKSGVERSRATINNMRERAHNDRRGGAHGQKPDPASPPPRLRPTGSPTMASILAHQAYLGYRNIQNTTPTPR